MVLVLCWFIRKVLIVGWVWILLIGWLCELIRYSMVRLLGLGLMIELLFFILEMVFSLVRGNCLVVCMVWLLV